VDQAAAVKQTRKNVHNDNAVRNLTETPPFDCDRVSIDECDEWHESSQWVYRCAISDKHL
jgi:hypothetical protein